WPAAITVPAGNVNTPLAADAAVPSSPLSVQPEMSIDTYGVLVALAPIGFFLLILVLGLVYEWSKGALDWE
ncbi:MAG: NADH-quinone oxidoreductase subunit A, partial [Caldilinea sp.]